MVKAISFVVMLLVSVSAQAWPFGWNEIDGPMPEYSKFHPRLLAGTKCEQILIEAEVKLKRDLTSEEIRTLLPRILAKTGEALVVTGATAKDFEPTNKKLFGGSALVLTNDGYIPFAHLAGDSIILSMDLKTGDLKPNAVQTLVTDNNIEFAGFSVEGRQVEATMEVEFLRMDRTFFALKDIEPEFEMGLSQDSPIMHAMLEPYHIGPLRKRRDRAKGYNVDVRSEPFNIIVDGLVVNHRWQK